MKYRGTILNLVLSLALVLAGCARRAPAPVIPPAPNLDHSIAMNWQQSFANNGACSSTITTSCISGFVEGYFDVTGKAVQLHTDTAAVCTGTTQPENCSSTFNGILPIGNVVFYVGTSYVMQTGASGTTASAPSLPAVVAADQATNVTVAVIN